MPQRASRQQEETTSKKSSKDSSASTFKRSRKPNGWAAVAEKQEEAEKARERREARADMPRDFFLSGPGDSAVIQLLHDEPYIFDGHGIRDKQGFFKTVPCQLSMQKHCLMCREQIRLTTKGAFKVLDYRGEWSKEKKKFIGGKPVEKIWVIGLTLLTQLEAQKVKRKKDLDEMVLEITRTGKGKNTTYNIEPAVDEDDIKMKPIDWDETFPSVKELCKPLSDDDLEDMGFEKAELE